MKGLAQSIGAAAILLALECRLGGAVGEAAGQERVAGGGPVDGADGARFADTKAFDGGPHLHRRTRNEDSASNDDSTDQDGTLDIFSSAKERAESVLQQRNEWADIEFRASKRTIHVTNGDRSSAASFHKTLPHDRLGQVDPDAFDALVECVEEGDYDTCEQVPAGDEDGFLGNPLGGIATDMAGPAGSAVSMPSAPALDSEDLAAQLAEVYWMSLTRDVPFNKYGEDRNTIAAADNLATMPGFAKMNGVAVGKDGRADPQSQLFRSSAVGVETGPIISQLLVKNFHKGSIAGIPMQTTFAPGVDYMTDYDDWLFIQNGGKPSSPEEEDPEKRYIRNARDLARLVATDVTFTEAFRSALVLLGEEAISEAGFNGPYASSIRQKGFTCFGVSHLMKALGGAEASQRPATFQKWNVHLFARPEAVAGTLHNVIVGKLDNVFHKSLVNNRELLDKVASRNAQMNGHRGHHGRRERTYLLSQAIKRGSPTHPSYPAGHAVVNGAYATVMKALVGLERGAACFKDPVYPDDDGLTLLPYTDCLTYEGEINKMAFNIAFGRQMCGVHYRMDSVEGLLLGETYAVRMLQQEVMAYPEQKAYKFRLMDGKTVLLKPNGSFYVDDNKCSGVAFQGAALC